MLEILQVIISVVVIYLIFSVVVFSIVEWIASTLQLRGKMLRRAIIELFRKNDFGEKIYGHPQLESLRPARKNKLSSYIPASGFASALIDVVATHNREKGGTLKNVYEDFLKGVDSLEEGYLKTLLTSIAQQSTNLESLGASIEKWFNDRMDRVSGWYARRARVILFVVSAVVTLSFNIDTLYIVHRAKADPALRQHLNELGNRLLSDTSMVEAVYSFQPDADYYDEYVNDSTITEGMDSVIEQTADKPGPVTQNSSTDRLQQLQYMNEVISSSDLPIGWPIKKGSPWYYVLLGWGITTLALTAGAPFWFDVLKKLFNLRSSGPKPTT